MKNVFAILRFDRSQFRTKWATLSVICLLLLALGFAQYGISNFKESMRQKDIFQDVEKNKVDQFTNYRQYGFYGFRVLFMPEPMSILFTSSTVIQDMTSYIDSGERLNIYKPLKGKNIFEFVKNWFADFSGILFFFGGLIALMVGYATFLNTGYQRQLASILRRDKLFFSTCGARAIELFLFFLFFTSAVIILITLNGISIGINLSLLVFLIAIYLVSLVFFSLGVLFGTFKSKIFGMAGAISSFFLLLFIAPTIVNIIISINSNFIKPDYQLELEKLKLMMNFEKKSNEKAGILDLKKTPADIDRELMLSYYKNEFQKMQALEDELRDQIDSNINLFYKLSSLCPTTFYLSVCNELSSKGYKTLQAFYEDVKRIKEAFFKEYLEKVYFTKDAKVEPFLKGNANVLTAKPALPDYFILGILFNLLWIAAFVIPAYYRFKKNLCNLPEKEKDAPQPKEIILKRGKANNNWYVCDDLLKNQLLTLLFNEAHEFKKKGYTFKVFLDDQDLLTAKKQQNFLYLCHPKAIPGHFVMGHFLTLVMDLMRTATEKRKEIISQFSLEPAWKKKFCQLDIEELGNVFLAILELKTFDVYLIDDIGKGMLLDFCIALQEKISILRDAEDAAVLFLWTDLSYVKKEKEKRLTFYECKDWLNTIESLKQSPTAAGAKYPKE